MAGKLIGYCMADNLGQMTKADAEKLDVIHVAFGLIENGEVYLPFGDIREKLGWIRGMNPEVKLVLSIGGWGADGFSQAAAGEEGRRKLSGSAVKLLCEYELDGIDIDWEYPCSTMAGIHAAPADKENYTLLLEQLRKDLDEFAAYKTLSIAAGAEKYFLDGTNMSEAVRFLDYVQLMTYDFRGSMRKVTGHHANLYSYDDVSEASAESAVRLFEEAGVPTCKLVIGAAFYGRKWYGVQDPGERCGLGREAETTGATFLGYDKIEEILKDLGQGYRKYYDKKAQAVWAYNGKDFISYEDKGTLQKKARYTVEKGLYGLMYWEYGLDGSHVLSGELYNAMKGKREFS